MVVHPTCEIPCVPPAGVQADIDSLPKYLAEALPSRRLDENLLIASWNLRAFSSLTREWTAEDGDSPKRDLRGLRVIGEIIPVLFAPLSVLARRAAARPGCL